MLWYLFFIFFQTSKIIRKEFFEKMNEKSFENVEKSTEKWYNFISKNECFERNEKTDKISAFFNEKKQNQ